MNSHTNVEIREYLNMLDGADMILDVRQSFMRYVCELALRPQSAGPDRSSVLDELTPLTFELGAPRRGMYPDKEVVVPFEAVKRALKNAAPQVQPSATQGEELGVPAKPARAASEAGKERAVLATEKGLTPTGQHIADCERDAARYRWLRSEGLHWFDWVFTTDTSDVGLDAAVDAARRSATEGGSRE